MSRILGVEWGKRGASLLLTLLLTLVLGLGGCKKPASESNEKADLLTTALIAQGGAEVLKSASTHSARYQGTLVGPKIKANMEYRAGSMRLKHFNPAGDYAMEQVLGKEHCWQKMDRVVLPCLKERRQRAAQLSRLLEASWLWPIKAGAYTATSTEATVLGKKYPALAVKDKGGAALGTLLLDPQQYLVTGLTMQTTVEGKAGELVGLFSKFEENCGVKMPLQREYTFENTPYRREVLSGVVCQSVDPKVFKRPAQIKHKTVDLKHTASYNYACVKHQGPIAGVEKAVEKLLGHLQPLKLVPEGPVALVYRKGPPKVKKPEKYQVDVCLPVGDKAWHKPKESFKGEFSLFERVGDEFLRGFTLGDYDAKTPEVVEALLKEAKSMKRKQTGPLVQVLYMRSGDVPTAEQVSEIHLPIYE